MYYIHILEKKFHKYHWTKYNFVYNFLFVTFLEFYDLDINLELKYYPSREYLSSLEKCVGSLDS